MANKSENKTIGNNPAPSTTTDRESLKEFFKRLKREVQGKELSTVIGASLSDQDRSYIQERLYKMIDYTVRRHDWYVDQSHRLLQIGLALIASGGVIVALVVTKLDNLSHISILLGSLFGVSLYGTGLSLVYFYNHYMAGDHPYRKVVDIHSWYFRYHFDLPLDPKISSDDKTAKEQVSQEAKYIEEYFAKFLAAAKDWHAIVREDIEQVSILLILQRYRQQQTREMSKWLQRGLIGSFVVFLLFILSLFLFPPRQQTSGASSSGSAITSPSPGPAPVSPPTPIPNPPNPPPLPANNPAPTQTPPSQNSTTSAP